MGCGLFLKGNKKMKTIKIISSLVGIGIALCLLWVLTYLCVPAVKDWTDNNVLHPNKQEIVKPNEDNKNQIEVEVAPNASINFATKIIKVEI